MMSIDDNNNVNYDTYNWGRVYQGDSQKNTQMKYTVYEYFIQKLLNECS